MSASPYKQLEQEFKRLHAFRGALSLLRWDAAVMMPRGSADVRGEQLAALETEYHALLTAPRITRLLDRAQANTQGLDDWQIANLREMRRQRDHAIATPVTLVSRLTQATSRAEARWLEARSEGKFELFAPHLEEVVHLVRDKAALLGQALNLAPYDALVDEFSPGITTADIDAMFKALSRRLPSLIREAIALQEGTAAAAAHRQIPRRQAARARRRGHEARSASPSIAAVWTRASTPSPKACPGDIRVTTRFDPDDVFSGLLGALHETGHAMYDLGLPQDWRDQPVGRDRGMALEESQSLLMEMIVCRSRPFVRYVQPLLAKHFGVEGPEWDVENVYAPPDAGAARPDPRGCGRADLSAAHHAALRAREAAADRRAGGARPAGGVEHGHGAAPGDPPRERRRGLPAGHPLGRRLVRLLPLLCAGRGHRRAALREPAQRSCRRSTSSSRAASSQVCSAGCARTCMGWAPRCRCRSC